MCSVQQSCCRSALCTLADFYHQLRQLLLLLLMLLLLLPFILAQQQVATSLAPSTQPFTVSLCSLSEHILCVHLRSSNCAHSRQKTTTSRTTTRTRTVAVAVAAAVHSHSHSHRRTSASSSAIVIVVFSISICVSHFVVIRLTSCACQFSPY